MTSTNEDGLLVSYDEETSTISLEWDPETHPQYNCLEDMTPEEFINLLLNHDKQTEKGQGSACEIQARRPSGRETKSNSDSGAK